MHVIVPAMQAKVQMLGGEVKPCKTSLSSTDTHMHCCGGTLRFVHFPIKSLLGKPVMVSEATRAKATD